MVLDPKNCERSRGLPTHWSKSSFLKGGDPNYVGSDPNFFSVSYKYLMTVVEENANGFRIHIKAPKQNYKEWDQIIIRVSFWNEIQGQLGGTLNCIHFEFDYYGRMDWYSRKKGIGNTLGEPVEYHFLTFPRKWYRQLALINIVPPTLIIFFNPPPDYLICQIF